jgi:hypothetical protein
VLQVDSVIKENKVEYFDDVAASRPASYPKVPGAISLGVKRLGHEADTHLQLVPRSRMVELYLHFRACLHGIVLN